MLKLNNVMVEIAGVHVLRGVTFALTPGKATILVGRNGAGKTTTLRTIMGLMAKQGGEVTLGDLSLDALPSHARAGLGIGYSPEDRRLIGDFTIEENILLPALALRLSGPEKKRRLEEVYTLLPQLASMRDRPGGGVSGGQGKMVALGRALMVSDKVLMLDEPFQGLAPALARDYARTLAQLHETKHDIAMLVTESSPHLLEPIADDILKIERGAITRAATLAEAMH